MPLSRLPRFHPRMILIVDGYNVIGAWPMFKGMDLGLARDTLRDRLADYAAFTGTDVTLVFDAHYGNNPRRSVERTLGIEIVYTRSGETADAYIERLVDRLTQNTPMRGPVRISVATSDALEQSIVLSRGALRISSPELLRMVSEARRGHAAHASPAVDKNPIGIRMPEDVAEKLKRMLAED